MIPLQKRKISTSIFLSIITLGLYQIYWLYLIVKNQKLLERNNPRCTAEFLLVLLIWPYRLYWWYSSGEAAAGIFFRKRLPFKGNGLTFLLLSWFGLELIAIAIMQNNFNTITPGPYPKNIRKNLKKLFVKIGHSIADFFISVGKHCKEFGMNFWYGDAITKSSHFVLGFSHILRGQIVRGLIYLVLEVGFVLYMALFGGRYLVMCFENLIGGGNIGRVETHDFWNEDEGFYDKIIGDNSFLILYMEYSLCSLSFSSSFATYVQPRKATSWSNIILSVRNRRPSGRI